MGQGSLRAKWSLDWGSWGGPHSGTQTAGEEATAAGAYLHGETAR